MLFSPVLEILLDDVSTVVKMGLPSDINKINLSYIKIQNFQKQKLRHLILSVDVRMVTQALV
jgi:hypothetical protein